MTLIVGLGNPGKEYENTRHNVGWQVLDALAKTREGSWKTDKKIQALIYHPEPNHRHPEPDEGSRGVTMTLLKPLTYMNNSGLAVAAFLKHRYFSTRSTRSKNNSYASSRVEKFPLIVLHDDIDLPLGTVRVSFGSSSGGHNGVQSIIDHLKTKDFWRIRIGVAPKTGSPDASVGASSSDRSVGGTWKQKTDPSAFVLKPFTKAENSQLKKILPRILSLLQETIETPRVQTMRQDQ